MNNNDTLEIDVKSISKKQIIDTLKVLMDNGIEPDEVKTVLQAVGYTLLNVELESMLDV